MNITLVTPTCDRPEAFALCERWMARQTIPIHQWIVLDDGVNPAACSMGQLHLKFTDTRGKGSLSNKLARLMQRTELITGDALAIIEDDDWYSPNYLELAIQRFAGYDMIGEGLALYYNVRRRWWHMHTNYAHASLCQTLIRRTAFPQFAKSVSVSNCPFIDTRIWADPNVKSKHMYIPENGVPRTLVGIKGIYKGYGIGHDKPLPHQDPSYAKLRELIGVECDAYSGYYQ